MMIDDDDKKKKKSVVKIRGEYNKYNIIKREEEGEKKT